MTDRELLEKAAKAAGVKYEIRYIDPDGVPFKGLLIRAGAAHYPHEFWNPLTDDGDALRLAVKLKIHIEWSSHGINTPPQVQASPKGMGHLSDVQILGDDPQAATRRAIVRAAAAIGEALL